MTEGSQSVNLNNFHAVRDIYRLQSKVKHVTKQGSIKTTGVKKKKTSWWRLLHSLIAAPASCGCRRCWRCYAGRDERVVDVMDHTAVDKVVGVCHAGAANLNNAVWPPDLQLAVGPARELDAVLEAVAVVCVGDHVVQDKGVQHRLVARLQHRIVQGLQRICWGREREEWVSVLLYIWGDCAYSGSVKRRKQNEIAQESGGWGWNWEAVWNNKSKTKFA